MIRRERDYRDWKMIVKIEKIVTIERAHKEYSRR